MKVILPLIAVVSLLHVQFAYSQTVNKCVDSNGNTTYSDRPCDSESSRSTIHLDSNTNVIDGSELRQQARTDRQMEHLKEIEQEQEKERQQRFEEKRELIHQQASGQKMVRQAKEIENRAKQARESRERFSHRAHAQSLQESGKILTQAEEVSSEALEMLHQSNSITQRLYREWDSGERRAQNSKAKRMRETAASMLNVTFQAEDPTTTRERPGTPTGSSSHNSVSIVGPDRPSHRIITNCDRGGCWDTAGTRYNSNADGSTFFATDGDVCQRVGTNLNCN